MTRDQQKELLNMFRSIHAPNQKIAEHSKKELPLSREEKAALALLARYRTKRGRLEKRNHKRFAALKEKARFAVFFGDDVPKAIAAIKAARDFLS